MEWLFNYYNYRFSNWKMSKKYLQPYLKKKKKNQKLLTRCKHGNSTKRHARLISKHSLFFWTAIWTWRFHFPFFYQNFWFSFNNSWFSKFFELILPLFGEKICPAQLNSLSHAAEAGSGVLIQCCDVCICVGGALHVFESGISVSEVTVYVVDKEWEPWRQLIQL